ncbi:hypothetical protein [Hazenella coriacea]|nr:hypothetical protein [Hazenella coriacea]
MNWVQEEIKQGKGFHTDQQQALIFDLSNGDQIRYQLKGRKIIRSVKVKGENTFQGYTVLMNHVYMVVFIPDQNRVTFDIGLQNWHTSLEIMTTISGRSDLNASAR